MLNYSNTKFLFISTLTIDRYNTSHKNLFQDHSEDEVYEGLMKVLQYNHLLNTIDAKCKANAFELVVTSFSPGINP